MSHVGSESANSSDSYSAPDVLRLLKLLTVTDGESAVIVVLHVFYDLLMDNNAGTLKIADYALMIFCCFSFYRKLKENKYQY